MDADVRCQGEVHRLRIDGDRLLLLDHDVKAEMGMVAMGGAMCPCLVIALWIQHRSCWVGGGGLERSVLWHDGRVLRSYREMTGEGTFYRSERETFTRLEHATKGELRFEE